MNKVGILGGGQLGRMMIIEGRNLPVEFIVLDDDPLSPACKVADKCYKIGEYRKMINECDVVTYEFEHVSEEALNYASHKGKLIPYINSIEIKRERVKEREFFKSINVPQPKFEIVKSWGEAIEFVKREFNGRAVVKSSKGGYDGKGQYYFLNGNENYLVEKEDNFVVEEYVDFDFEASVIISRGLKGEVKIYEPMINVNMKGVLVYSYGFYRGSLVNDMKRIAEKIVDNLNYIGVLAVEFFVKGNRVLVNEIAPRVHNTGHYTLDSTIPSQFEQHLRAILGIPLADIEFLSNPGMVNILGLNLNEVDIMSLSKIGKVYWYGKEKVFPRRKMGHINTWGKSMEEVIRKIKEILELLYGRELNRLIL